MSRPSVRDHPEYPFRPGSEEPLQNSARNFLDAPRPEGQEWRLLNEFVVLVHRFAFLERLMQGDVLYELPVHFQASGDESNPEAQGERLANAERGLLDWMGNDAGVLPEILDSIGIKVLALEPGPDADVDSGTAAAGEDGRPGPFETSPALCGGFLYEGRTGPALLVGTMLKLPEAAFVLAHEFAHLVADINPYRARFCRWNAATLENLLATPEEKRADRFARALLLPEARLKSFLALLDRGSEKGSAGDLRARQLSVLFDVPPTLLGRRMEDLGMPPLELPEPQPAARRAPPALAESEAAPGEQDLIGLPERFVNLALAAYGHGLMEVPELALFLRTSPEGAGQMLDWAHVPRNVDTEDGDE